MFGENLWMARVNNVSNGAVSGTMQSDTMQAFNQMMGMMGGGRAPPGAQRVGPNLENMNLGNMNSQQMERFIISGLVLTSAKNCAKPWRANWLPNGSRRLRRTNHR